MMPETVLVLPVEMAVALHLALLGEFGLLGGRIATLIAIIEEDINEARLADIDGRRQEYQELTRRLTNLPVPIRPAGKRSDNHGGCHVAARALMRARGSAAWRSPRCSRRAIGAPRALIGRTRSMINVDGPPSVTVA